MASDTGEGMGKADEPAAQIARLREQVEAL